MAAVAVDPGERTPLIQEQNDINEDENQVENTTGFVHRLKQIPFIGFAIVATACGVMTLAGVFVKVLVEEDPFVLTGYRNAIIFLCSAVRLYAYKISPDPPGLRKFLILRGLFVAICSSTLYYSFRHLPLGDARALTAAQPIFVTLVACVFLRESCGIFDILALIASLLGMFLLTQPPFIFGQHGDTIYNAQYYIAAAAAIGGMMCQAFSYVATRAIKQVDFAVVTAWSGLFGSFIPILFSVMIGTFSFPLTKNTFYVFLIGFFSFLGQSMMTLALQVEEAGTVSLLRKTDDILLAFALQILYFKEIPNALAVLGAVVITTSVLIYGGRKIVDRKVRLGWVRKIFCLAPMEEEENR